MALGFVGVFGALCGSCLGIPQASILFCHHQSRIRKQSLILGTSQTAVHAIVLWFAFQLGLPVFLAVLEIFPALVVLSDCHSRFFPHNQMERYSFQCMEDSHCCMGQ